MANLEEYREKRTAGATPEPFGRPRPQDDAAPLVYVMQKHNARRLHYDLRLELDGVLKSWAVPNGPSYDQATKSLAVQTEDHPVEYAEFEGVIPKGNYGAGEMIVWDRGTLNWLEDPHHGFEKGKLLFELHGHKLKGKWTLVKIKKGEKEWLLIKERDALEGPRAEALPDDSILTGRTIEDLKAGRDPGSEILAEVEAAGARYKNISAHDITPMLASSEAKPFARKGWLYELKYDGYRMIVERNEDAVRLVSRNGNDLTRSFPDVVAAVKSLPHRRFIIDSEVVVQDESGIPRFQLLQKRARVSSASQIPSYAAKLPATLYVFDLLAFAGYDIRSLPLIKRKELLRKTLPSTGTLRYSEHVADRGIEFFAAAEAMGLEGMVAKKADSPYRNGRSTEWIKVRAHRSGDFVIIGFKASSRARGFGSFHVAAHRDGSLMYAGSVGTGLTTTVIDEAWALLKDHAVKTPTAAGAPKAKGDVWVEPRLCCAVRYLEWTEAGNLRHPVFLGLRTDKNPDECVFDVTDASATNDAPEARDSVKVDRVDGIDALDSSDDIEPPLEEQVKITNPNKIFFPEHGYTKGDLIAYYRAVAPFMLRYLRDRPVVLTRFPDGIHGKSFFQKDAPGYSPAWLRTETVYSEGSERDLDYFIADDERSLVFLANAGSIPLHIWSSRVATLEKPDWCVMDLDPKGAPFTDVVKVARAVHDLCEEIGMPSYVKSSGSSGLHILLPLGRQCTHDQSRVIGELMARTIVNELPDIATITRVISKREGRVYIDYLQNGHGKLIVAPYAVRAIEGAPVSAPLTWKEVNNKLDIRSFTIKSILPRLKKQKADPIAGVLDDVPDLVSILSALQSRLR